MTVDDSTISAIDNLATNQGAFFVILLLMLVMQAGLMWLMWQQSRASSRAKLHETKNDTLRLQLEGATRARENENYTRMIDIQDRQETQIESIRKVIETMSETQKMNTEFANEWRGKQSQMQGEFQQSTADTLKTIAYALSDSNKSFKLKLSELKGAIGDNQSVSIRGFRAIKADLEYIKQRTMNIEKRIEEWLTNE